MVDKLTQIINITVHRTSSTVSQAGFGKALLIGDLQDTYNEGYPGAWATRVIEIASLDEIGPAGHNFSTAGSIYKATQAYFSQTVKPTGLYIGYYDSGAAETPTTGLAAIRGTSGGDDWYALACTDRTSGAAGDAWELAQLMQTENRIFVTASADATMLAAGDVTSTSALAAAAGHQNTAVMYHSAAAATTTVAGWADMAWLGRCLPEEPGEITWGYMTLTGIAADDALNTSQRSYILDSDHYSSYYDTIAGVAGTRFGNVSAGYWLDSIRLAHWCAARIQEAIYAKFAALGKVPFTDSGISMIKGEVRKVLERKEPDAIAEIEYITAPKAADVSDADKGTRTLRDLAWAYTEAGAIHTVIATMTVSV